MRMESEEKDFGVFIYNVYLSEDEIREIEARAFDYWRKEANIPGYRKGMAPESLVYQKYSENIEKTFKEILTERIRQEVSKKHRFGIDSVKIVDQKVNQNKNLIEIPGQVSRNEFVFTVKVSTKTMVIVEDEEKIKSIPKDIKFVSYSFKKDTVDIEDLKKFFFSSKKFDNVVKDGEYKCVVEIYLKLNDTLPAINLHFYLENFRKLADKLKNKKVFESFDISLDKEIKEIIRNYLDDVGISNVEIPNNSEVMISKILKVDDSDEIVKENMNIFAGKSLDPNLLLPVVLENYVYRYNVLRLIAMMMSKVIPNVKIYVGENEYISSLLAVIRNLLLDYSYGILHISSYPTNFDYYSGSVFRSIVERNVVKTLYTIFVGRLNENEEYDDISEKLYEKLKDLCSVEVKEISYSDLKDKLPYLFFDFISKG
ncbi:MAG: trigger factor [Brevinematia bacterium]